METVSHQAAIDEFVEKVKARNPHEPEFIQAIQEAAEVLVPFIEENPKYKKANILERLIEPERVIMFRVPWVDDEGNTQVNRGYRVQYNSALGPYKGGIRFHPSVNLSILKFLGFEQILKNSLSTLSLGGGKGGADFNPRGKSENEVMRFCQSFMNELYRHIGPDTDIPAGDIGVGAREVGYMFGQYKRLQNNFTGVFTGKGVNWGGSLMRTEATGFGTVYFAQEMLEHVGQTIAGKTVAVSGSGNVAQHAFLKAIQLGAKVVTLSDSGGFVFREEGFDEEHYEKIKEIKNVRRERISVMADEMEGVQYFDGQRAWEAPTNIDIAMPCATQNELDENDAKTLLDKGLMMVVEGANMPTTLEALHLLKERGIPYSPGKASNAGGVSTSGLEMTQNSMRLSWSAAEVDEKLHGIMKGIHAACVKYGTVDGKVDYVRGSNLAGFIKVADAMIDQGAV